MDFDFDFGFCYGFCLVKVGGVTKKLDDDCGWLTKEEK